MTAPDIEKIRPPRPTHEHLNDSGCIPRAAARIDWVDGSSVVVGGNWKGRTIQGIVITRDMPGSMDFMDRYRIYVGGSVVAEGSTLHLTMIEYDQ